MCRASDIRKFNVASQRMGQISDGQTSEGEHQHASLFPNIQNSTFHQPQAGIPLSRTENVLHAFLYPNIENSIFHHL